MLKILSLLVICIVIVSFLVWIDLSLGKKKHYRSLKRTSFPLRYSNFQIFTKGTDLFADLFTEIKKAKYHIHILFYICKKDDISKEFLLLLKEKAEAGVEVRLMLDRIGSNKLDRKLMKEVKKAGVQFYYTRVPAFPYLLYFAQVRNHRKITVIDGKIGYIGGFNVGKEYIDLDPKLSPWRDYHVKLSGEGVRDLQTQFLSDWQEAAKVDLTEEKQYFPSLAKGKVLHKIYSSSGNMLEETLAQYIKEAKQSIFIGSPYFIPSKHVMNELLAAIDRGVTLAILVPHISDHPFVKQASYPFLQTLYKKGATIYEYHNGFYHAKVLLIDDEICDLGTANFDERSMKINDEINCFIFDQEMIKRVKEVIDEDLNDSRKVTLDDLKAKSFGEWVQKGIALLLTPYL